MKLRTTSKSQITLGIFSVTVRIVGSINGAAVSVMHPVFPTERVIKPTHNAIRTTLIV